jgi:predicted methyltransferase
LESSTEALIIGVSEYGGVKRRWIVLLLFALAASYVIAEAARTLWVLELVEMERDRWQRPDAVLDRLRLHPGSVVVDLGAGAGYFALKAARAVSPNGEVLAIDLRRESLAFLWVRSRLRRLSNVRVVVGAPEDPHLSAVTSIDGVLIANTLHELQDAEAVLRALQARMRPSGRLVIVDRRARRRYMLTAHVHEIEPAAVRTLTEQIGFSCLEEDDAFIDRAEDDDIWWLEVFERR